MSDSTDSTLPDDDVVVFRDAPFRRRRGHRRAAPAANPDGAALNPFVGPPAQGPQPAQAQGHFPAGPFFNAHPYAQVPFYMNPYYQFAQAPMGYPYHLPAPAAAAAHGPQPALPAVPLAPAPHAGAPPPVAGAANPFLPAIPPPAAGANNPFAQGPAPPPAGAPIPPQPHPHPPKPPTLTSKFSGESNVKWEEFELLFTNDRLYGQWSDQLAKTTLLRHLSGVALTTYASADATVQNGTCNDVLNFLRDIFQSPTSVEHYEAELNSMRQLPSETPQAFEVRVRNLVAKAYPGTFSHTLDSIGKRLFLDRLRDSHLAHEVRKFTPRDLHEARTQVELFSALASNSATPSSANNTPRSDPPISRLLADHKTDMSRLQRNHERQVTEICNKVQHMLSSPPNVPPQQQAPVQAAVPPNITNPTNPLRPSRGLPPGYRCHICNSPEHLKALCPHRPGVSPSGNPSRLT
ncbi:uncharacterized protein LOC118408318 [Branchiostoma floridae]|uniref:Uncharacterized protein LOC118408318 n=1 Tax=Branchiostoma floridae TaxID=7739 RepID=A0A9J7HSC0_BRAFL|nr:uncharacterized protein LOC118408318 [Branchiostoma floridae]